jgi:hypothetical protein
MIQHVQQLERNTERVQAGPLTFMSSLIMLSMVASCHTTLRAASMFIAISFVTAPAVASRMQNTTSRTMVCSTVRQQGSRAALTQDHRRWPLQQTHYLNI